MFQACQLPLGHYEYSAKVTFPMKIYFSVIEIGLYSVYRKLVLATLKPRKNNM